MLLLLYSLEPLLEKKKDVEAEAKLQHEESSTMDLL